MKTVKTTKEHFDKYNELFIAKGKPELYIPATKEEIIEALNNGDEHLNTIPLIKWDNAASCVGWTRKEGDKLYSSLAEKVCLLKHYAIYKVAKFKPKFDL